MNLFEVAVIELGMLLMSGLFNSMYLMKWRKAGHVIRWSFGFLGVVWANGYVVVWLTLKYYGEI